MKRTFIVISLGILSIGCETATSEGTELEPVPASVSEVYEHDSIREVSAAHHRSEFLAKKAVKFDLQLTFGGKERMNGSITLLTNSTKGLIELKDGSTMIYSNGRVFHSPGIKNEEKVRFDAYTWPYFFLFPFKLEDKGTHWSNFSKSLLNGKEYNTQRLTFASGTGDAPDDWYVMYSDLETNLVRAAAYIVTLNKSQEEAEKDPHAIEYTNYKNIEGIPLATKWTFWGWRETEGLTDQLGKATISNIEFLEDVTGVFDIPVDYLEK